VPGGQILIVDDDLNVLGSLARVLEGEGYRVACCSSGTAALAWVATATPDVILLDLLLPGMSGRQFLSELHDGLGRTDIPVVLMTGMRGMDPKLALSMGASDVIEKPFDMDELLNKIALALFRAHGDALPSVGARAAVLDDALFLFVSDDPRLGRTQRLLGARGHRVVSLLRATEELPRLARVLLPRLILLDLHVPGVGGLVALRRLRAERALDAVPLVMLASDAGAMRRAWPEIRALGAAPMVQPRDDEEFLDLLTAPPAAAWPDSRVV
jgi:DNA-binding response OmpR family regulator